MSWREAVAEALPEGAAVLRTSELQLGPEPRNVSEARRFVAAQVPEAPPEVLDTLLLLTSELVTNGVVHARTALELGVAVTADDVVVAVHDLDLGRREQRTHERSGGRGLVLVSSLACASGRTRHAGGGKTAWFRVCLDPARCGDTGADDALDALGDDVSSTGGPAGPTTRGGAG